MRKTTPGFGWRLNSIVVLHKITCGNLVEGHRIPRSVMRSQRPSKLPRNAGCASPPVSPCAYRELSVLTVGVCRKGDGKENATQFANSASKVLKRGFRPRHTGYACQCHESVQEPFLDPSLKLVTWGAVSVLSSNPRGSFMNRLSILAT